MIPHWLRRKSVRCWVIKQVDEDTLHLCESGHLVTQLKRKVAERQLARGEYRGGVRMGDTGIVLNSELFEKLVPWPALSLDDQYCAHWQGRRWSVSRVPQRCWAWDGRLVAKPGLPGNLPAWQSTEDLSRVRERADASEWLSDRASFRPENALEDPEKDIRGAIARNRARQKADHSDTEIESTAPREDKTDL